jgi:hypothetical protein
MFVFRVRLYAHPVHYTFILLPLNNRFKEPDLHDDIIDADRGGRVFLGQS